MRRYCYLLALVVIAAITLPAPAGVIFGKRGKPNPAERVPQLVIIVKTDPEEKKRETAAREMRDFDPKTSPDIVPVLIDVLQHDQKSGVRAEAATSLGKLRPISQEAGWALEEATKDASAWVRWQARSALLSYRLSGYRNTPRSTVTQAPSAPSPQLTSAPPTPQAKRLFSLSSKAGMAPGETAPPPLAPPVPESPTSRPPVLPRPGLVPTETPRLQKPPAPAAEQGPELPPN
jgi:hypothetical protein